MRICQILCGTGFAGLERHTVELVNGLAARGHEVALVAHAEFAQRLGAGVSHVPLDLTGWRANPVLLVRLLRALRRQHPDIVHAQANKAAAMVSAVASFVAARRIATVHNIKQHTGMFRRFDGVIAVSRAAAAQLTHPRVRVIHNGIAPPPIAQRVPGYTAQALGRALPRPLVLAVGRLVPAKGFDILIRAWEAIDATLVIAGEGPDRALLERMISEHGMQDRVCLAGHRSDVPALLADADLFVIASRREGFPYAMVEALHTRKVIVATRVPGADEILPETRLVNCEDAPALAACIRATLADLTAARADYAPVWDYAAAELTVARMVEHTEAFYREVLAQ